MPEKGKMVDNKEIAMNQGDKNVLRHPMSEGDCYTEMTQERDSVTPLVHKQPQDSTTVEDVPEVNNGDNE